MLEPEKRWGYLCPNYPAVLQVRPSCTRSVRGLFLLTPCLNEIGGQNGQTRAVSTVQIIVWFVGEE